MNALLKKFVEDMAACGYDLQDTINRAHSMAVVARREKSAAYRREFREALYKMDLDQLKSLIEEIELLEGGEQ